MANEFRHADVTTTGLLTETEHEGVGTHIFNSQAAGDILYASSATQLSRLGIGATNKILTVIGGVPTWQSTLSLGDADADTNLVLDYKADDIPQISVTGTGDMIYCPDRVQLGRFHASGAGRTHTQFNVMYDKSQASGVDYTQSLVGTWLQTFGQATEATSIVQAIGASIEGMIRSTNTQNWTHGRGLVGADCYVAIDSGATGTITAAIPVHASANIDAATVTNLYNVYIMNGYGSGTVTNQYGIYIADQTKGATLDYGIYIAGADTYAIYVAADGIYAGGGITLGDVLTLNGEAFDAGSGDLRVNTTGADGRGLIVVDTHDGSVGARLTLQHVSASPSTDDYCGVVFKLKDAGLNEFLACHIIGRIEDVTDGAPSGRYIFATRLAGNYNEAMTLSAAGLGWFDVGVNADEYYQVAGTQVVGARVVDVRCDDAINSGDATTDGVIDALRDAMITHGLVAAA